MATYCNKSHAQPESESTDVASSPAAMKTGFNASVRAREEEMSGLVYRVHAVPESQRLPLRFRGSGLNNSDDRRSEHVSTTKFDACRFMIQALTQKAEKMYIRSMVAQLECCSLL